MLRRNLNELFLTIAKTWLGGLVLHWVFAYFSFTIPGEKLIKNDSLLAFHHPSPSYPLHILIVPKEKINTIEDLPSNDNLFEIELFKAVRSLVDRFELNQFGFRLITNGGSYQEVDHLHFHLISEDYNV